MHLFLRAEETTGPALPCASLTDRSLLTSRCVSSSALFPVVSVSASLAATSMVSSTSDWLADADAM